MSWIRIAIAGLAVCAGATVAGAQGPPSGAPQGGGQGVPGEMRGQGRGGMQAMLFEGITLTEAQQRQIDAIRANYKAQRQQSMPNGMSGGPPDAAKRAKMTEMQRKQNAELRAVLTAEQQVLFDKNAEEMKQRRAQRGAAKA